METEKKVKTILVFCAEEQKETEHTLDIAGNGEIVLTCVTDGRSLKFPKGTTADGLKELIAKHKISNEGQISQAKLDAEKEKLIGDLLG